MATQILATVESYFFLCNPDFEYHPETGGVIDNRSLPELIRAKISQGKPFFTDWRCANSKSIEVGARAYLLRTVDSPTGIIAAGQVIAAPKEMQLRRRDPQRHSDLSEAYVGQDGNNYYVYLAFDSVVDFDYPLEQRNLKSKLSFQGVNFYFAGGGKRFAPDNPTAVQALASEWETHSIILQGKGKGRRLVDVFLEKGDQARKYKNYEAALRHYEKALEVDPNYGKAVNRLNSCQAVLEREKLKNNQPVLIEKESKENGNTFSNSTSSHELSNIRHALDLLDHQEPEAATDSQEERQRVLTYIVRRQGQTQFRQALLEAYGGKCAVTGFDAEAALEAAHIIPYGETGNNDPTNGVLLRADLHTLFDLNLLVIHPDTMQVLLCSTLQDTEYRILHGKPIRIPKAAALRPNPEHLRARLRGCLWLPV